MTSLNIKSFLRAQEQTPEQLDLLTRAQQLNQINQTMTTIGAIPKSLSGHYKLGPLSNGTLILLAGNASVATKLKHLTPSILSKIRQSGWKITAIKIKLQKPENINPKDTESNHAANHRPYANTNTLSQTGFENLNHLAQTLPDSELKRSIQTLLKKCHKTSDHN